MGGEEECLALVERSGPLSPPPGWLVLPLTDFNQHIAHFPTICQELSEGHIQVIGKTTSKATQSSVLDDLLGKADADEEKVGQVTLLQVRPTDLYMSEMARLLASFHYEPDELVGIATGLSHPTDRTRWTWLVRLRLERETVADLTQPPLMDLQLWHFHTSRPCWQLLLSSLTTNPAQRLGLTDPLAPDEVAEEIASLVAAHREVELTGVLHAQRFWELLASKVRCEGQSRLQVLSLTMLHHASSPMGDIAKVVAAAVHAKLSMLELNRAGWEILAVELSLPTASLRCLALEEVVNMASESTFSFAKAICSVPEVRLSDVRLANDLWEIVAKRLRQRESRLIRLEIFDMEFTNTEFTQFSLSVVLIRVVEFREIRVSKSQWGSLGQALAKKDTKIEKLVLTSCSGDPVAGIGHLAAFVVKKKTGQIVYKRRQESS